MNTNELTSNNDSNPSKIARILKGIAVTATTASGAVVGGAYGWKAGSALTPEQYHPEDTPLVRAVFEAGGTGVGITVGAIATGCLATCLLYGPFSELCQQTSNDNPSL